MPNRIIKESINESKGLSECSLFAQDLFKRLITYSDDYGRFNADAQIMRARLYPRELDIIGEEDIECALVELSGVGKIDFYTSKARKEIYGCFPGWADHQRVRDSKTKCPEPDNMEINDWYLRRFVSLAMKADIIERGNFKCQECGKFLTSCTNAKKFAKLGSGTFHIDHIVPCSQGGRATIENLRLLCPTCNLTRKRHLTYDEIVQIMATGGDSRNSAASRRESPPESNPIQSESNPNANAKRARGAAFTPPSLEDVKTYCFERKNDVDPQKFFDYYDTSAWVDAKGNAVKNWKQKLITWEGKQSNGFSKPAAAGTGAGDTIPDNDDWGIVTKRL